LNRIWSFQAYHRSISSQAAAYVFVYALIWVLTVVVVAYGTGVVGLTPWQAKIAAVIVTLPIGFLGHKYFTFGTGIASRGARDER
jgi:putative flippase GtrA